MGGNPTNSCAGAQSLQASNKVLQQAAGQRRGRAARLGSARCQVTTVDGTSLGSESGALAVPDLGSGRWHGRLSLPSVEVRYPARSAAGRSRTAFLAPFLKLTSPVCCGTPLAPPAVRSGRWDPGTGRLGDCGRANSRSTAGLEHLAPLEAGCGKVRRTARDSSLGAPGTLSGGRLLGLQRRFGRRFNFALATKPGPLPTTHCFIPGPRPVSGARGHAIR